MHRMEALGWIKDAATEGLKSNSRFSPPTQPPDHPRTRTPKTRRRGFGILNSQGPFFCTSQLIAKDSLSAFSQLLLLQILSPIVKKICKI
jgi:hypothetical protein